MESINAEVDVATCCEQLNRMSALKTKSMISAEKRKEVFGMERFKHNEHKVHKGKLVLSSWSVYCESLGSSLVDESGSP